MSDASGPSNTQHSTLSSQQPDTVVIPAAGKGTRLLPLTRFIAKEMLPLGRKPVLQHIIDEVADAGIAKAVLVVSPDKLGLKSYFESEGLGGLEYASAVQEEQLGLGHAVLQAEEFVGGRSFSVALGDSIIYSGETFSPFTRLLHHFAQTGADAIILVQQTPVAEANRYGLVKPKAGIGEPFEICDLVEKPGIAQARKELSVDGEHVYAIAGRYALKPAIFEYLRALRPGAGGELQLTDAIRDMLADGLCVWCTPLREGELRRDIGTFETYFEAFCVEALKDAECGARLRLLLARAKDNH